MAALSTSIILRPVLLAVLLVDAAEAAENLKRRGEFLSSISAGGHFVTGFDKDKSRPSKPLLVRVPSRFFEASSACSSATHCSIICEELIGKGNDKAKVAPVVEEVERLEQQRLEAAAAGSRQTTTFKLEPCTAWNGGRGLGEIPGLELASLKKEQEGAATMRHLPGARFFHAFPRGSAFLARWDPIRELFVLLQRRFVQAVGYPLNAGELAGKLGPSRAYGDLSYLHVMFAPEGEVAMALGAPQFLYSRLDPDAAVLGVDWKVTYGTPSEVPALVHAVSLFDDPRDGYPSLLGYGRRIPLLASMAKRAFKSMLREEPDFNVEDADEDDDDDDDEDYTCEGSDDEDDWDVCSGDEDPATPDPGSSGGPSTSSGTTSTECIPPNPFIFTPEVLHDWRKQTLPERKSTIITMVNRVLTYHHVAFSVRNVATPVDPEEVGAVAARKEGREAALALRPRWRDDRAVYLSLHPVGVR